MATTVPPTRYDDADDEPRSSGRGGAGLIALSIVAAGAFIAVGIFLALVLRPTGISDARPSPSSSGFASGRAESSASLFPSAASAQPSASLGPTSNATNLTQYAWHNCQGVDEAPAQEETAVDGVEQLYDAATESRGSCLVDEGVGRNIGLSYHGFDSREAMDAAFESFAAPHSGHPAMCQDSITGGYGRYSFEDGRNGLAVCLRNPQVRSHFVVWTNESANVITVAFTRRVDAEGAENLLTFWRDEEPRHR